MRKKINIFLGILFIFNMSACTTLSGLDDGLNALVGKDFHQAFDVLGYPTEIKKLKDTTVYVWRNDSSDLSATPPAKFDRGDEDDRFYHSSPIKTPYNAPTYQCKIYLSVDTNDVIVKHHAKGQLGACKGYIDKLDEYLANSQ